ncbi:unnamed protein product [Dovyalis caffra]|uniref:Lysozyme n=1 Tax=Dovyalis caffra TaxID=77055 RepID=A0AAV1SUQ7_9ROSI|nr:unnamed protein product [Dovyalis caffra]
MALLVTAALVASPGSRDCLRSCMTAVNIEIGRCLVRKNHVDGRIEGGHMQANGTHYDAILWFQNPRWELGRDKQMGYV